MRDALRAGIAVYTAGDYHAAHDAWEERWLDLETGSDDERLLHGLIQFTAAIHHARNRNWEGATGLAASAREYLAGLPADYRGVNVADVRRALAELAADPEAIERRPAPALAFDGEPVTLEDLGPGATALAAVVYAETDGLDEEPVQLAAEYALADDGEEEPFRGLLFAFVREPEHRGVIYRRLSEHVERRRAKERDVEGLFD